MKIMVAGAQHYFSFVLWVFMELLSHEKPDWLGNWVPTLWVTTTTSSKTWSGGTCFPSWRTGRHAEHAGHVLRNTQYIQGVNCVHQFPIKKAMLSYQQKCSNEEESFHFLPFLGMVEFEIVGLS